MKTGIQRRRARQCAAAKWPGRKFYKLMRNIRSVGPDIGTWVFHGPTFRRREEAACRPNA